MGPKITDRLGHAREQGARADRGALPVRPPVRADRGRRPPDLDRPRARALPRRRLARAPRVPGHARADLVRAHVSGARGDAGRRRSTSRRPDRSSSRRPDVETFPHARARARGRRARRDLSRAPTTPRTRSPSRRSSPAACRSSGSRASSRRRPRRASTARRRATSTSCVEADGEARRLAEKLWSAGAVNIFIAIVGLALLDPRPRGGPLLRRERGRHERRGEFYIGFPPAIVKRHAEGHRVRDRRDPARRLREDPGDAPARAVGPEHLLRAGARRGAAAGRADRPAQARARRGRHRRRARRARRRSPRRSQQVELAGWRGAAPRGAQRARGRARRRRVLAPADLEAASLVIFAGPADEPRSSRSSSSPRSSSSAAAATDSASRWRRTRRSCTTCAADHPAAQIGLRPGDRILSDQRPARSATCRRSPDLIQRADGRSDHAPRRATRATPGADGRSARSGRARSPALGAAGDLAVGEADRGDHEGDRRVARRGSCTARAGRRSRARSASSQGSSEALDAGRARRTSGCSACSACRSRC